MTNTTQFQCIAFFQVEEFDDSRASLSQVPILVWCAFLRELSAFMAVPEFVTTLSAYPEALAMLLAVVQKEIGDGAEFAAAANNVSRGSVHYPFSTAVLSILLALCSLIFLFFFALHRTGALLGPLTDTVSQPTPTLLSSMLSSGALDMLVLRVGSPLF